MNVFSRISALCLFSCCLLMLSSCDDDSSPEPVNDPEPENPAPPEEPEPEPYLYIHADANINQIYWVIVTNGHGEIVGYKEIDPVNAEEISMVERLAEIQGNINVYRIAVNAMLDDPGSSYSIMAYLDQAPGKHMSFVGFDEAPDYSQENIDVNVYNLPEPFWLNVSAGDFSVSNKIDLNADGINDTVKLQCAFSPKDSEYFLTAYDPVSPKYAIVKSQQAFQDFTYPDDFLPYDHEVSMPLSDPGIIIAFGVRDKQSSVFLISSDLDEAGWNHSSIKVPYLNGYDHYVTYYSKDSKSYEKVGSIPSAENMVIPDRVITVTNSSLYDFEVNWPAEIDYRQSYYSIQDSAPDHFSLIVFALKDAKTSFDLVLPDDFTEAHRTIDFSSMQYDGSYFVDVNIGDLNKIWLAAPSERVIEKEEYSYYIPR